MAGREGYIVSRIYLVYLVIVVLGLAVIGRILYIQTALGDHYEQLSRERTLRYFEIEENRGNIYAADGSLLSTSVPTFNIRLDLDPSVVPDDLFLSRIDSLSRSLSTLFRDRSPREYRSMLMQARQRGDRYFLLRRNVTYPQLKELRTFPILRRGRYGGGMIAEQRSVRVKPFRLLAERTIGYDKADFHVGLEGAYREELDGISGRRLMRRITNNMWVPVNDENEIEPQDGNDIVTNIDVNIQDVAEHSLLEHLAKHDADHGCAVLMEVSTGYVVAIANLRRTEPGKYIEDYNFAVGESAEPGSTFKLASLMVALEDGRIRLDESVDTREGVVTFYGRQMRDSHHGGYGEITLQQAFELSSNVGISLAIQQAYGNDPSRFVEGLRRMSLGDPLGLELSGEGRPRIKGPGEEGWSGLSLPWMSIGYEVALTPLQTLTFYNAVANDGVMVKPLFVREIRRGGLTIRENKPEVINPAICSKKTLAQVRPLLEGVVERGTARQLSNAVYSIAGKTGTAQIASPNTGYNKKDYRASFVGYFPAQSPKYSCIVVIDGPRQGYIYGAAVAAPVFRDIADKVYATHLDIQDIQDSLPPISGSAPIAPGGHTDDLLALCSSLGSTLRVSEQTSEWIVPMVGDQGLEFVPRIVRQGSVPNVKGMNARDAVYILESLGLSVHLRGRGTVNRQSVEPGSPLSPGAAITLELS